MARRVDEPRTKCRNFTDHDWTRAFAHDGQDPHSWILGRNLVEDGMSWNRVTLQTNMERGSVARDVLFAYITFPGTLPG